MPLDLTGIQNVGEFYSHHYLDALLENDLKGLFAKWRSDDDTATAKDTPDRRLERLASDFFKAKAQAKPEYSIESRYEPSHRIHVALLEALGYHYSFEIRYINGTMAIPVLGAAVRDTHEILWLVETPFAGKDGAMQDDASPLDQRPFRQQYPQHVEEDYIVPDTRWEDLIGDIFHTYEPPRWVMLVAGRHVYLIDRTKWGRGQYLLFDLDEILGRKQSATLRATAALLSKDALCPDDGVPLHDTLDENSHKHAYGVSSDLKYGLRKAVEMLANEYVYYQRTSAKQALFQDENLARKLTDEALIYMYRLLFLLYAEARAGELDVVPVKAEAYLKGYSLESLRDLELVPLTTQQAQNGYYIHESLNLLFNLVDEGHNPQQLGFVTDNSAPITGYDDYGFRVKGLHSPLFNRQRTPLLSSVKFRNSVLQEVIQLLSLSRQKKGRKFQRGRISYAQLGINQLGAVYEALLSYSGFFASERMYEVKPADANDADETAQTYFIPESELGRYEPDEFVYEESGETSQRKSYEKGTFIFRLAGRDREKSASYYTPEVLTQCTVKYSLKELLKDKSADDILKILLLEPAMGSGAFANEGINQLADAYLERKQKELGKRIPADDYRTERQKVKYYLAVNNTYGVDLNPTAVELARVSLWLNVMYPNSPTPWFGARLATGNSLIGARRQVYSSEDVKSGAYASKAPEACPMHAQGGEPADGKMRTRPEGSIYHWLLPDAGMAAFDSDKVIKELAPAETAVIKKWRNDFKKPFTAAEIKNLIALSDRADELWQKVLDERLQFLEKTRQPADVWEHPELGNKKGISVQQCERELDWLHRPTAAYARLKLAMDYWCALWFWQIPEADKLPTRQQFLDDMAAIFNAGEDSGFEKEPEQMGLFNAPAKPKQAKLADLKPITIDELLQEPRLNLATNIATRQRFHHWELSLPEVFNKNNGFDLIVGNPPWVKVRWVEENYLADIEPLIDVRGLGANWISENRSSMLKKNETKHDYFLEFCSLTGTREFIGSTRNNPELTGTHANLYKCFLVQGWKLINDAGYIGFLHPIAVFDDPKGGLLRSNIYQRLKYHFQFINEFKLFPDVGNQFKFSVNIYQSAHAAKLIDFNVISNLVHPATIDGSFSHDGLGTTPGMKNKESNWDIRGHKNRIIEINQNTLELFSKLFDDSETTYKEARLPLAHSKEIVRVLQLFNEIENKLENVKDKWFGTQMFHETYAEKEGIIVRNTKYATSLDDLLIQGPHFFLSNPFHQTPKEGFKSHRDYESVDLMAIPDDYLPRTNFQIGLPIKEFQNHLPHWKEKPVTDYYRLFFSSFINPSSQRTLQACIFPPGPFHKSNVLSLAFTDLQLLVFVCGLVSSLPYDFWQKITGKVRLLANQASLIPLPNKNIYKNEITARVLRLNCLSTHFSFLWKAVYVLEFNEQQWSKLDFRLSPWNNLTDTWRREYALRHDFERRQALIEIDVLAAMSLGFTFDELLSMYRVQFPVLQDDEHRLRFDQRGMEVPMKTIGGELGVDVNHPKYAEMVPPFTSVDREEDYRVAWAFFEKKLKEQ